MVCQVLCICIVSPSFPISNKVIADIRTQRMKSQPTYIRDHVNLCSSAVQHHNQVILFLNCHAFTFCIFSCMFDNFLKLTYLYAKVCLEMKILLQNCKLNLSNSFHSRTLDTSILLWNQNLYEVVPVFYSQGNSQPFNLYPDF